MHPLDLVNLNLPFAAVRLYGEMLIKGLSLPQAARSAGLSTGPGGAARSAAKALLEAKLLIPAPEGGTLITNPNGVPL